MAAPLAQQLEDLLNPRPDLRDPEDDAEEGERGSEKGSVRPGPGRSRGLLGGPPVGARTWRRGASAAAAAAVGDGASWAGVPPRCASTRSAAGWEPRAGTRLCTQPRGAPRAQRPAAAPRGLCCRPGLNPVGKF